MFTIPTEPIGSIPRPPALIEAVAANPADQALESLSDAAVRDTMAEGTTMARALIQAQ